MARNFDSLIFGVTSAPMVGAALSDNKKAWPPGAPAAVRSLITRVHYQYQHIYMHLLTWFFLGLLYF